MVGTMWVWVTPWLLDEAQRLRRLPMLHDHQRHAVGEGHGQREGERRRVVERPGDTGGRRSSVPSSS